MSSLDGDEKSIIITKLRHTKIRQCKNTISDVINHKIRAGSSQLERQPAEQIEAQIEKMESKTEEVIDNPDALRDINLYIRRILLQIVDDLGYGEKVNPEETQTPDDISTLFFWYRTIVAANLDDRYEPIEHEYIIHALNEDRNDIEHGTESSANRPDTVGVGIITWYALEEILQNYQISHSLETLDEFNALEESNKSYGYIVNLEKDRQTVAPFDDGINGNNIHIELSSLQFFPSEGDPVGYSISSQNPSKAQDLSKLI